jgi:hypothetical protein
MIGKNIFSFFLFLVVLLPPLASFHSLFFLFGIFFFFFSGYLSSFVVLVSLSTLFLPFSYSNVYTLKSTSPFTITSFFLSSVLCLARTERKKITITSTNNRTTYSAKMYAGSRFCILTTLFFTFLSLFCLIVEKRTQDSFLSILSFSR